MNEMSPTQRSSSQPTAAAIQLKVINLSGEQMALLSVDPLWPVTTVKTMLQPYITQADSICLALLTSGNSEKHEYSCLDDDKRIGDQVRNAATLTAMLGADPVLVKTIEWHVNELKAHDVSRRYHAAEALADLGPRAHKAHLALEQVLLNDRSGIVRKSVALALGFIGAPESVSCLAKASEQDVCQFVRARAKEALAELRVGHL